MMTGLAGVLLIAALSLDAGQAQAALDAARELYVAADYEGALAAFDRLAAAEGADTLEVDRYRALCLIALGRTADAEQAIERVIRRHPDYQPDEQEAPRVRAAFAEARARVLPDLARSSYTTAKAAYDSRNHAAAVPAFERTLAIIDSIEPVDPALGDLRTLAAGFLDLSRAAVASAAATAAAAPASDTAAASHVSATPAPAADAATETVAEAAIGTSGSGTGAGAGTVAGAAEKTVTAPADPGAVPPAIIRQDLPAWSPPGSGAQFQSEFQGAVEVVIDDQGAVVSARIVEPVHPTYDQQLLEATTRWRYQPATRGGKPVTSTKRVEVVLRPRS